MLMARIVTVTAISEEEGARLSERPGAHPCVDDQLAGEVRRKMGTGVAGACLEAAETVILKPAGACQPVFRF